MVAVGFSDDGRPSLAGCWVLGEQLIAAAVDAGTAPYRRSRASSRTGRSSLGWVGQAHPLAVAYLSAAGDPQVLSLRWRR